MRTHSLVVLIALLCPVVASAQNSPALALAPSVQSLSSPEKAAIVEVLGRYSEAAMTFDPDILASTVHPEAVTTGGVGQPLLQIDRIAPFLDQLRKMRGKMKFPVMNTARTITDLSVRGDLASAVIRVQYLPSSSRLANTTSHEAFQMYKTGGHWTILSIVSHVGQYEGDTDGRTFDVMGVRPGMTVGEIGAGEGRVTLPLARRVGTGGKVYANDINEKALASLRTAAERTGTRNIETVIGKADDPLFPKGALDLAVTAIVYHHLTQPVALLKNLAPSLKPGATVVIMDPAYDRTGDKDSDRPTTRERVETEAAEAGYELVAMDASLPRENIFILRPKSPGSTTAAATINTTPYRPAPTGDERAAILAAIDRWWKGHDTDDAVVFDDVMAGGTRSWFAEEGALQFMSYDKEIERIKSGNRRPAGTRPLPGEKRSVVDFAQQDHVAAVTMLVEIPRGTTTRRSYTTFQLYKADDRWQIVNLAGYNEPAGGLP